MGKRQRRRQTALSKPQQHGNRKSLRGQPSPNLQFDRPDVNTRVSLTIVPQFAPNDPQELVPRPPEGSPGIYRVIFVLGIPGHNVYREHVDFKQLTLSGESLLMTAPRSVIKIICQPDVNQPVQHEVTFGTRGDGSVESAQVRVQASNFREAHIFAHDLVSPFLSWWSFEHDVAIDISAVELFQEATQTYRYVVGLVGKKKALGKNTTVHYPRRYNALFAAYREGLNATNVFYQILCFVKVIEGIKKLRDARRKWSEGTPNPYLPPVERIPATLSGLPFRDPVILDMFKPYLGMKFGRVQEKLGKVLRNAVSHVNPHSSQPAKPTQRKRGRGMDPDDPTMTYDKFEDVAQCEDAVHVMRYMSRMMLEAQLQAEPKYTVGDGRGPATEDVTPE